MKKNYYAVRKGKTPGIYFTWDDCNAQVKGFKGAEYKKFSSLEDANNFIENSQSKEIKLDKNSIIAYVDGSYNIDTKIFSYGIVLIDQDGVEVRLSDAINHQEYSHHRNVAGEVYGSIEAIKWAIDKGYRKIYIHYDYAGIGNWAKGEWKANKELTKKYKDFIDSIKAKIDLEFIKVKAHSNNKYNDIADRLAKDACGIK